MKIITRSVVLLAFLLAGCAGSNQATPTATPLPSPTRAKATLAPTPTAVPPTVTASFTPTAEMSPTVEATTVPTPATRSLGDCPPEKSDPVDIQIPRMILGGSGQSSDATEKAVLGYLNSGVSRKAIISAFQKAYSYDDGAKAFQELDVTGDGAPELIVQWDHVFVFACAQGSYETLLRAWGLGRDATAPTLEAIQDMNQDGLPEIVTSYYPFPMVTDRMYDIYEWNGVDFQSVTRLSAGRGNNNSIEIEFATEPDTMMSIQDVDGNGTLELLLSGGVPPRGTLGYYPGSPLRKRTDVYSWDGKSFELFRQEFDPPVYRFQAVQDGDRASLYGEYDKALAFYQAAIFSDKLAWWTEYLNCDISVSCPGLADPSEPKPTPDPNEYPHLEAYSRLRIMLLHVLQGHMPEAKTVYDTLIKRFPEGAPGYAFAQMAAAFWSNYQETKNITSACGSAVGVAEGQSIYVLGYLGDNSHGDQSLKYEPESVCPFTDQ